MRTTYIAFISYFLMITSLVSCDKVPANGALDGMWQIMTIEHNGSTREAKEDQKYISFQLEMIQLSQGNLKWEDTKHYYGHFKHEGSKMRIYDLCKPSDNITKKDDDIFFTTSTEDMDILDDWGLYELDNTFDVETLNGSQLVLSNNSSRIVLRKY